MKQERIFLSPPHLSGEEQELTADALASNYVAPLGPMVDAFEREFAAYTGLSHCLAVSSGTAALHLALHALNVQPGDVVLASTLTFIGGVTPILFQGAQPVFIDCTRETWTMDPERLEEAIEHLAQDGVRPRAVVPTDLYGQCADYERIDRLCRPRGIPVVADAAEAMGATRHGAHAGRDATAAVFSFNGNKIMTTSGGGMLASEDEALIRHARKLSQQARDDCVHYEHSEIGYNYRMSNILAAIGRAQLRVLDERVRQKRAIFDHYRTHLGDLPGISFMPEDVEGHANRWLTVMLIDPAASGTDRERIRRALDAENIEARPVWKPMHLQPVFSKTRVFGGAVSEAFFEKGLCLPSGTALSTDDLVRIVGIVRGCFP